MLIGIPPLISPALLLALYQMGHGDEIVVADAHFPATSVGRRGGIEVIRADGISIPALLEAIAKLFPLDTFDPPVAMMAVVPGDNHNIEPTVQSYASTLHVDPVSIVMVERHAFYERSQKAFAIVASGDGTKYGNIILKKGLVRHQIDC